MLIISDYMHLMSVPKRDLIITTADWYNEKDGELIACDPSVYASGTLVIEADVRYEFRGIPFVLLCAGQVIRQIREQSAEGKEVIDVFLPDLPSPEGNYIPYAGLHRITKCKEDSDE